MCVSQKNYQFRVSSCVWSAMHVYVTNLHPTSLKVVESTSNLCPVLL